MGNLTLIYPRRNARTREVSESHAASKAIHWHENRFQCENIRVHIHIHRSIIHMHDRDVRNGDHHKCRRMVIRHASRGRVHAPRTARTLRYARFALQRVTLHTYVAAATTCRAFGTCRRSEMHWEMSPLSES